MNCLELNWFVYDPRWMLHLSEFVWTLRSSVLVVFTNFLLIDTTDRSNICCNQQRFFVALSLYPLSFFANTPFKEECVWFTIVNYSEIVYTVLYVNENEVLVRFASTFDWEPGTK